MPQKPQMTHINSVTVLGAGTMGAQIALHCANAGIPALLLDLTADVAKQGLEKARKLKPDPQFTPDAYKLVTTGGFDTHLDLIAKTDWIMEAVIERLDIKQQLLAKVDEKRRPGTIVSSNTSGIPIAAIAEGRSEDFRKHWLGTHFFNPPRYLRLLEIIPTAETDPAVIATMARFGDHVLGKGVVIAKDTPNFIANHVGLYGDRADARSPGDRQVHDRRDRCDYRTRAWPSRQRDVPDDGHRRHRRAGARAAQPQRAPRVEADRKAFTVPPLVEQLISEGRARRESRQGLLRAAQERHGRDGNLDARSRHARVSAETIGAHRVDRGRQVDR